MFWGQVGQALPSFARYFSLVLLLTVVALLSNPGAQTEGAGSDGSGGATGSSWTGPSSDDPESIARSYLQQHQRVLGLTDDDLKDMVVRDRYFSEHNQVTHLYFRQRYEGIEVFNGDIGIHIDSNGKVIHLGNRAVSNLKDKVNTKSPAISDVQAVQWAAQYLGLDLAQPLERKQPAEGVAQESMLSDGGISRDDIPVKLMYQRVPVDPDQPGGKQAVQLVWRMVVDAASADDWWDLRVDAQAGQVLSMNSWTHSDNYEVYALPNEHPNDSARTIETNPADPTASPFGWHDTDGVAGAEFTTTRGNNVSAYPDRDDDNSPDATGIPDGGAGLDFTGALVAIDLGQEPSTYVEGAVTNLFYWNNIIHDVFYAYGFDEGAGNFQENNYGNPGAGSDAVQAEAQDGADVGNVNNANFATPPDGLQPRMQMFEWDFTSPRRDGDLDNGIITHEYGHGISNRMTGGPANTSCLFNNEQMGEGWSDFFALALTASASDTSTTNRGLGTYSMGQAPDGVGIRPTPYNTDLAVNPSTYGDIGGLAIPHGVGYVWATMAWDMYWGLVDLYGFNPNIYDDYSTGGNNLALQLVVDGLALQPCEPGFVDGRDAILAADQALTGGENQCTIWEAFRRRGLGFSASQGSPYSTTDGIEAFDLPPVCDPTLQIHKSADPPLVSPGNVITYNLDVLNNTPDPLTGVVITDQVPVNTSYVPGSASDGGTESGGVVTWPPINLASGDQVNRSFQVEVDSDTAPETLFFDDMEGGPGNWTVTGTGPSNWTMTNSSYYSPATAWFAEDVNTVSDQQLMLTDPVAVADTTVLRFWHSYNLENGFDGGVAEVSVDGGPWEDLGPLMTENGYNGILSTCCENPLPGRAAFTGFGGGYLRTSVDLGPYSGSNVQVRFRLGTDASVPAEGWYVDDVEILNDAGIFNSACVDASEGDQDCDSVSTPIVIIGGCTPTGLYGSNGGNGIPSSLHHIDPSTGMATPIGSMGFNSVGALDFHPTEGTLYGVGLRPSDGVSVLLMVDPCTAFSTEVGPLNLLQQEGVGLFDLSFRNSDGTLFLDALGEDCVTLYTVDLGTGAATLVGETGTCGPGNAMGFSQDDILYHSDVGGVAPGSVNTLDQSTGIATNIATLEYAGFPELGNPRPNAMDFDPTTGVDYLSVNDGGGGGGPSYLSTLDPTTGVATYVGPTVPGLDGLAWSTVANDQPSVAVDPTSLETTLPPGSQGTLTLDLNNIGGAELSFSFTEASTTPPLTSAPSHQDSGSSQEPEDGFVPQEVSPSINGNPILLLKDVNPWQINANEQVLDFMGVAYDVGTSAQFSALDLTPYSAIVIASDQSQEFYDNLSAQVPKLESFLASGKCLDAHVADSGWNGGQWTFLLPGGVGHILVNDDQNFIVEPNHPVVKGLTDSDYVGWNTVAHGHLTNLPTGGITVLAASSGNPTTIEYPYGNGSVTATMQTLEWAYKNGLAQGGLPLFNHISALADCVPEAVEDVPWLSVDPTSGAVPPGGTQLVEASFDATGLAEGDYQANLNIASNDPAQPLVMVPVTLHVEGANDTSTLFNPDLVALGGIGSLVTVDVDGFNIPPGVDGVQISVYHPDTVQIPSAGCGDMFPTGTTISPVTTPASDNHSNTSFGCFLLNGDISSINGQAMSFDLERTMDFTEDQLVVFNLGGPTGTQYSDGGVSVDPGTTNSLTVVDGVPVEGHVFLEFCPVDPACEFYNLGLVTAELTASNFNETITVAPDGYFMFEGVSPGDGYTLRAFAPGHLYSEFSGGPTAGFQVEVAVDVGPTTLPWGDGVSDDFVNINDITLIVSKFGQTSTDCQVAGMYVDANCDGFININDITGAVGNFGRSAPQPWAE